MSYSSDNFMHLLPAGEHTDENTPQWWEAQNIPWQLVIELRRRKNNTNIGLFNTQDMCINFKENYSKYRGSMTPWVRCFSNGTGRRANFSVPSSPLLKNPKGEDVDYDGFLLEGGAGFYKGYGVSYQQNGIDSGKQILGYDAKGNPHCIYEGNNLNLYNRNNDKFNPTFVPPPGIVSVDIQTMTNLITSATVKWKCYGIHQLEYMLPFFLTPRLNVFLEFGWNLFNIKSLVNYNDLGYGIKSDISVVGNNPIDYMGLSDKYNFGDCLDLIINPQNAYERYYNSLGNYGVISGIIHKYDYIQKDHVTFDCTTEIISRQALYAGYKTDNEGEGVSSLKQYFTEYIKELINVIPNTILRIQENTSTHQDLKRSYERIDAIDNSLKILNGGYIDAVIKTYEKLIIDLNSTVVKRENYGPTILASQKVVKELTDLRNKDRTIDISSKYPLQNTEINYLNEMKNKLISQKNTILKQIETATIGNFISFINKEKLKSTSVEQSSFYNGKSEDRFFYDIKPYVCINVDQSRQQKIKERISGLEKDVSILQKEYIKIANTPGASQQDIKEKYEAYINKLYSVEDNKKLSEVITSNKYIVSNLPNAQKSTEGYSEYGWVQLDFVFELINYIVGKITKNKIIKVNINDTIITAHPNMISSNPNVLIPSTIAPKVNIAKPLIKHTDPDTKDIEINDDILDYINANSEIKSGITSKESLKKISEDMDVFNEKHGTNFNTDKLINLSKSIDAKKITFNDKTHLTEQTISMNVYLNQTFTSKISNGINEDYLARCQDLCARVFLTNDINDNMFARDNLDMIINYNYYNISGKNPGSAAFPSCEKHPEKEYMPYTYGYLKYIYVSISSMIDIFSKLDEKRDNLKAIISDILNLINESVGYFWNFDIVQQENGNLQVVDKNISLEQEKYIYMFEIGTTDSMIKNFSFDVNLTNEQTTQILYSTGNNLDDTTIPETQTVSADANNYIQNDSTTANTELSNRSLPSMAYKDRLENIIDEIMKNNNKETTTKKLQFKDSNIEKIQSGIIGDVVYYRIRKKPNDSTNVEPFKSYDKEFADTENYNEYSYVMLNLPVVLRSKLKQILYTPTITNFELNKSSANRNVDGGYTGPADNFIVTLTFDGIMGFRLFQYFAIANLPAPYKPENIIFMIKEVKHVINKDRWETVVTAMLRSSANQGYKFVTV